MGLECEWHHARKWWRWEVEVRPGSWELTLGHVGRQLGCLPQWQTVEVGVRPCWWEVGVRPCWWEVGVRPWCWEIEIGPRDVPSVRGVVSIVWLQKTFKNCLSLLVSKNQSQKLINAFVPEQRSRLCLAFVFASICICTVVIIRIMATSGVQQNGHAGLD